MCLCAFYAFVCGVFEFLCDVVWCARRCGVSFRACVSYLMSWCVLFVLGWLMLYGVV